MKTEAKQLDNFALIYDYMYTGDLLPNALNHSYSQTLLENHGFVDESVITHYRENYVQLPNLNAYLDVNSKLLYRLTFYEYQKFYKNKSNMAFCYPIEPYANINHVLGADGSFDKKAVIKNISEKALKEIRNPKNNFYLLIAFTNEGTMDEHLFEYLYNICYDYNIPNKKLIFSIACPDVEEHHQKFVTREKIPPQHQIKTFFWHWSLRQKADEAQLILYDPTHINQDKFKTKPSIASEKDLDETKIRDNNFLIFNRRLRDHRISLISLLGRDFISNNLVSYDLETNHNDTTSEFFKSRVENNLVEKTVNNLADLYEHKPKSTIDFDNIDGVLGFGYEVKDPYINSYIHICTETNFYDPGIYFSEKTWKPILNLQPFINVNYQGALKHLQQMGFETFHPFIDESYDKILDPKRRLTFIYNEIERINNLPKEEIHEWYYGIKDKLVYNQQHALAHRKENKFQIQLETKYIEGIKNYVLNS